jgi:hypothetical protein
MPSRVTHPDQRELDDLEAGNHVDTSIRARALSSGWG